MSRRKNLHDDLAWETPVNLGPAVNTASNEGGPSYVPARGGKGGNLYFSRDGDIYEARVGRDGEVLEPAVPVTELNTAANENTPTVRADGREIFFWSNRAGGLGGTDIWTATRRDPAHPWSSPRPVGAPVNTPGTELEAKLSWDGRTLLFAVGMNARPSLGFQDIWMSTRTPSGH
jgi:hypothetical protein